MKIHRKSNMQKVYEPFCTDADLSPAELMLARHFSARDGLTAQLSALCTPHLQSQLTAVSGVRTVYNSLSYSSQVQRHPLLS